MKWKADWRLGKLVRSRCHCVVSEFDFCDTRLVDIPCFSIGEVGGHWVGRAGRCRPSVRSGLAHILTNILVFLGTLARWCNTIFISTSPSTPPIGTLLLLFVCLCAGLRTRAGYEYYGERVSNTPSLHSKSLHRFLDAGNLIVV